MANINNKDKCTTFDEENDVQHLHKVHKMFKGGNIPALLPVCKYRQMFRDTPQFDK